MTLATKGPPRDGGADGPEGGRPLRVLDIFSGIGSFSLGLERAGMQTVAFCEIDPFCRRVLAKHWPNIPCHADITTREFIENEADVICGGFPCQDISTQGKRAGITAPRSGLWREMVRAIGMVRPRYAIVENVAALLSNGLGTILGDLAEIGYDTEVYCIRASDVGAPHRRDRVWVVAYPHRLGLEGAEFQRIGLGVLQRLGDRRPWPAEPRICRVDNGTPDRKNRLKALGNSLVPRIPELIGRAIGGAP
jgi:DNA (cytosine-5)-methyltransferase 1